MDGGPWTCFVFLPFLFLDISPVSNFCASVRFLYGVFVPCIHSVNTIACVIDTFRHHYNYCSIYPFVCPAYLFDINTCSFDLALPAVHDRFLCSLEAINFELRAKAQKFHPYFIFGACWKIRQNVACTVPRRRLRSVL